MIVLLAFLYLLNKEFLTSIDFYRTKVIQVLFLNLSLRLGTFLKSACLSKRMLNILRKRSRESNQRYCNLNSELLSNQLQKNLE